MSKIDIIIDALSVAQNSVWSALNEQALAAARELQAEKQEPQMIQIKDGHLSYIKKPWVGLTTEESSELYNKNYDKYDTDMTYMDFFTVQREVEAKLREKNGG